MSDLHTMTLTEFLLARIAEDEAVAREATAGPWVLDEDGYDIVSAVERTDDGNPVSVIITDSTAYPPIGATRDHILRHDPARVLAECEANRAIVEWHHPHDHGGEHGDAEFCDECQWDHGDDSPRIDNQPVEGFGSHPCRTLAALALPYADHADYLPEWKP